MGIALSAAALAVTLGLARRALWLGVSGLLTVGYAYGILRANFPDGFSHFMFDASVAGLYLGHFLRRPTSEARARGRHSVFWLKALSVVPVVMFLVPLQHPLVQLVGLRAAIYFLPLLVVGARLEEGDLDRLARWVAVLNVVAVLFGTAEFLLGVDRFYPLNPVTELIFRSTDVGEERALRIPALFSSAHAFGGMMVGTLPLLVGRWTAVSRGTLERRWLLAAAALTVVGIFMCGARTPVVLLFALGLAALLTGDLSARRKVVLAGLAMLVVGVVSLSERLQRFSTLHDLDYVQRRIGWSANRGLVDVALEYPLGAGLARAAGTSLPFFMADMAEPQIGLENEFGRLVVEQGLLGLAAWVAFIAWTLARSAAALSMLRPGRRLVRSYVFIAWGTAFIGTGMLTAIPGTALLLLYMGVLAAEPSAARHRAAPPREAPRVSTEVAVQASSDPSPAAASRRT